MICADFIDFVSAVNVTLLLGNLETVISLVLLIIQLAFVAYKLIYNFVKHSNDINKLDQVVDDFVDDVTELLPSSDDQNLTKGD